MYLQNLWQVFRQKKILVYEIGLGSDSRILQVIMTSDYYEIDRDWFGIAG